MAAKKKAGGKGKSKAKASKAAVSKKKAVPRKTRGGTSTPPQN